MARTICDAWAKEMFERETRERRNEAAYREAESRDAARYRFLRELPHVEAQAYFWLYTSRRERDRAIDASIERAKHEPKPT